MLLFASDFSTDGFELLLWKINSILLYKPYQHNFADTSLFLVIDVGNDLAKAETIEFDVFFAELLDSSVVFDFFFEEFGELPFRVVPDEFIVGEEAADTWILHMR